jgi:hypothetical protein
MRVTKPLANRTAWKGRPQRVTVPYVNAKWSLEGFLSKSGHVKPRLNPRGPSRKAKYSLTTDSEPVERSKDGKNRVKRRIVNLKPCAYKRSEHYGLTAMCDGVPFA